MAITPQEMQQIVQLIKNESVRASEEVYKRLGTQYGVPIVPFHIHDGTDSPRLPPQALEIVDYLPANTGGVVNPTLLQGQIVDNPVPNSNRSSDQVPIVGIPIIYGSGTTANITFTSTRPAGAVSGTLTAPWGGSTPLTVGFSSGETRLVSFSGTAATWAPPLETGSVNANAVVIADSRFKGGDAPYGSVLFFRNDDDNIYQLWVKSQTNTVLATWWGFDAEPTEFRY